jgi:NAD(P)-dependent dehydrogenase (short-subunit alcohol dehydrogenase family)
LVIQVIGADSGIGEALAIYCLKKGHQVGVGLYSYNSDSKSKWNSFKDNTCVLKTDVCDEPGMQAAAGELHQRFGMVDVVVNVAGILTPGDRVKDIVNTDFAELRDMMEVNAFGVLTVFRVYYPVMNKGGLYAAITAGGGTFLMEDPLFPAYVVTKTAANKLVQTIKNTVNDVRVCAIHPGRVNTPMGRTTAQIEPEESVSGIYKIVISKGNLPFWFLNYDGNPLPI